MFHVCRSRNVCIYHTTIHRSGVFQHHVWNKMFFNFFSSLSKRTTTMITFRVVAVTVTGWCTIDKSFTHITQSVCMSWMEPTNSYAVQLCIQISSTSSFSCVYFLFMSGWLFSHFYFHNWLSHVQFLGCFLFHIYHKIAEKHGHTQAHISVDLSRFSPTRRRCTLYLPPKNWLDAVELIWAAQPTQLDNCRYKHTRYHTYVRIQGRLLSWVESTRIE